VSVQRRFDRQWNKERVKSAKHARLMAKRPELREALYGQEGRPPDQRPATRETAHEKDDRNG
jgi:hypothetical protein